MSVAPLPWKVTSLPSMVGSLAGTLMGLFATGAPLAAGLAAAEPDAAGLAEADAGVEAAGLAEALAAGEAAIEGLAAAGELAGAAAELTGAVDGAALPPQPMSDRMDAAEATPPAMCSTRRIMSRRDRSPSL